jgi:hypothetical protein
MDNVVLQKSLDKTALACSRRIYRLTKDKIKEHSLNVYLKELLQDPKLTEKCQVRRAENRRYIIHDSP